MRRIQAALAFLAVGCTYGLALVVCRLARRKDASPWSVSGRIAVCGTFHNPSWFRSHTTPLGLSVTREVVVVTDSEQPAVERVRLAHLSPWLSRTLGRPLAKLVRLVELGRRERPDLYMGYHLIPNSVIALVASRLFARPSCYQMTAGPNEVEGGGFRNDNAVLSRLQRPSQLLERLALAVVREFDLVVVRGAGAERFLAERGVSRIAVIRGSVDPDRFAPAPERPYHLLYVGQLIERKQPLEFLEIVAALAGRLPALQAVMLGDGHLRGQVEARARELGLDGRLEIRGQQADVESFLGRGRVFVLPSRSEGLSIAMAEAMMAGAVPVVTDVGELGELVQSGVNGYLLHPGDRQGFVRVIDEVLRDGALWARLSGAARSAAIAQNGLDHVASLWSHHLEAVVRSRGGRDPVAGSGAPR